MVKRVDARPFAGAFLSGGVEDFFDERRAVFVLVGEDVGGDVDEVAVQLGFFPVVEDGVHVVVVEAEAVFEDLVGLADELHVAVFDAVMHHFDEVPRAVRADPVTAGFAVLSFGGDGLQDGFDVRPGVGVAAGHDGGAVARAFFAAGDAHAEVADVLFA